MSISKNELSKRQTAYVFVWWFWPLAKFCALFTSNHKSHRMFSESFFCIWEAPDSILRLFFFSFFIAHSGIFFCLCAFILKSKQKTILRFKKKKLQNEKANEKWCMLQTRKCKYSPRDCIIFRLSSVEFFFRLLQSL